MAFIDNSEITVSNRKYKINIHCKISEQKIHIFREILPSESDHLTFVCHLKSDHHGLIIYTFPVM